LGRYFNPLYLIAAVIAAIVIGLSNNVSGYHFILMMLFFLLPAYIVDRLRVERELKKYRDHLEAVVKERTCKIRELYRQIEFVLGSTKTGLDIIDADYNVVYIDPEWEKTYGNPAGKKCYEYFMGKDERCPGCGIKKALETEGPVVSEEVLTKEGNRPIRVITTPYQDDKGKWLVAEINVDISKEKLLEDELEKHRAHLEALIEERTRDLKESEKRFRLAFENAMDAIVWADPDSGTILNCNEAAEKLFERPRAELVGQAQTILHPADGKEHYSDLFKEHAGKPSSVLETEIVTRLGGLKTVLISASSTEIEGRMVMQGVFHDITIRKEMEKAHRISEESYRSVFESANDAIIIRDIKSYRLIDANNRACEMFCYNKEEMLGLPLQAMLAENLPYKLKHDWDYYDKAVKGEPQLFEVLAKDKLGRTFWVEVSLKRAIIGDKYCLLAITRDITERKYSENKIVDLNKALSKANEGLKHMALRDSHTGLYNHRYFVGAIEAELERAKRHSGELSVIMMDIDYFKSINDVYGHQFGDAILRQFAKLLKNEVRLYDIVVRFGGEEFIIISPNTGKSEVSILAHRLLNTIGLHSFGDKKHSLKIKVSAAICSYPSDKRINNAADFVDTADRILDKAKEAGGNRVYSLADLEAHKGTQRAPEAEPTVDELKEKIKKLTVRGNQSVVEAIFAFAKTIELKDRYTGEHVEKTIFYVTGIAQALGLPKDEIEVIKEASALHDLGKIGIPEKILLKPGKLTKREREVIKEHPQIGVDIIRPLHFLRDIIPLIRHHHEWWNGKGYPDRLRKDRIPLGARIVAIADVYQALTSDRPYHKAYSKEEAIKIIRDGSGTQFDPKIVETFLDVLEKEK